MNRYQRRRQHRRERGRKRRAPRTSTSTGGPPRWLVVVASTGLLIGAIALAITRATHGLH